MLTASFNSNMKMMIRGYRHEWKYIPVQMIGRWLEGDADVNTKQKYTIRVISGVNAL